MTWYLVCNNPEMCVAIDEFPCMVGRDPQGSVRVVVPSQLVSREQFVLSKFTRASCEDGVHAASPETTQRIGQLDELNYVCKSQDNPATVNGTLIRKRCILQEGKAYRIEVNGVQLGLCTNLESIQAMLAGTIEDQYYAQVNGGRVGPYNATEFIEACCRGEIRKTTEVWVSSDPKTTHIAADLVDWGDPEMPTSSTPEKVGEKDDHKRAMTVEEVLPELGESFMCPYCRTVSDLSDVFSVSVSIGLLGDSVLGAGEQRRFLPSQFTANGLAIDAEGGVCTEIACPHCHMSLPRSLLDTPQMVMSVIGAAGAGKSVFLASCIWQCRQLLLRRFGVGFMDLDPVANRWINAYEEKFFFQEDDTSLQQIEKTDLQDSHISRSVMLNGDNVLLPLPSFFQLRTKGAAQPESLVVYDSAGEHFRAGADTQSSAVTLNMLNADVLFFMFDPSADPRFRGLIDRGEGTAQNYAQRQDVLLAEMAARIRRHLGNKSEQQISKPLLFGISKADLLHKELNLNAEVYQSLTTGGTALDLGALRKMSDQVENLLMSVVPEVVATARDISSCVWFIPVSALGHNPMRDGVRPRDIKPLYTELPVVFTMAKKGLIPTVGGTL